MIDTLEAMSEDDPAALDALAEVGQKPFETGLATPTKRALAGEKYDVFVALARKNRELAPATLPIALWCGSNTVLATGSASVTVALAVALVGATPKSMVASALEVAPWTSTSSLQP